MAVFNVVLKFQNSTVYTYSNRYPVCLAQYVPIITLVVLTLTLIEAAGAADYRKLPGIDQKQQTSAKIMQVKRESFNIFTWNYNREMSRKKYFYRETNKT